MESCCCCCYHRMLRYSNILAHLLATVAENLSYFMLLENLHFKGNNENDDRGDSECECVSFEVEEEGTAICSIC